MKTCELCDKDILEEDVYTCDWCGRKVCPDCIVNIGTEPDNPLMKCKRCMERG